MEEVAVELIPLDVVRGDHKNHNECGNRGDGPEEDDAAVSRGPPAPGAHRPIGIQLLLEHHVCHLKDTKTTTFWHKNNIISKLIN